MTFPCTNVSAPVVEAISDALLAGFEASRHMEDCLGRRVLSQGQARHAMELQRDIGRKQIFDGGSAAEFRAFAASLEKLIDWEPRTMHVADPYAFEGVREETYVREGQHELRDARRSLLRLAAQVDQVLAIYAAGAIADELDADHAFADDEGHNVGNR